MKIVITRRFEKEFLSKTYKYFKKEDFIDDLKFKSYKVIFLCKSFSKFKSKLNSVNFRGVVSITNEKYTIPLVIFLKKDKKYGENIIRESHKKIVEKELDFATKDIENGNFEEF